MSNAKTRPRKPSRFVTRAFSLPREVSEAIDRAAGKRFGDSKSAIVTEILAEWFEIAPADPGGEPEKQQIPA